MHGRRSRLSGPGNRMCASRKQQSTGKRNLMISGQSKEVVGGVDPWEHLSCQSCCSSSFLNPYESEGSNKPLYTMQIFLYHKVQWVKVRFSLKDWTCRHASFTWLLHVISNLDTQHIPAILVQLISISHDNVE